MVADLDLIVDRSKFALVPLDGFPNDGVSESVVVVAGDIESDAPACRSDQRSLVGIRGHLKDLAIVAGDIDLLFTSCGSSVTVVGVTGVVVAVLDVCVTFVVGHILHVVVAPVVF